MSPTGATGAISRAILFLGVSVLSGVLVAGLVLSMNVLDNATLSILPCIAVFLAAQRWFVQGVVVTGISASDRA